MFFFLFSYQLYQPGKSPTIILKEPNAFVFEFFFNNYRITEIFFIQIYIHIYIYIFEREDFLENKQ